MFLTRIAGLAKFLAEGEKSMEQITKFLVLNTFVDLSPDTIYIAEIIDDGYLTPIGSFGFPKLLIAEWGRFPLTLHVPMTQAVHLDKCVIIRSLEDLFLQYPVTQDVKNLHTGWAALISFPMSHFGAGSITLTEQPTESVELFEFIGAIGAILALQFWRITLRNDFRTKDSQKSNGNLNIEFTERQKIIYQLMFKGFTNAQIATEVGYSESLIRQETMKIFRVLGVSGRKEIIQSPPPAGGSSA